MEKERIEIEMFDIELAMNIQATEAFIEISDKIFRYCAKYDCQEYKDEDDHKQGVEDVYHDFDLRVRRDAITVVEKYWVDKKDFFKIDIEANGYPSSISLRYQKKDEAKCQQVFEKLSLWALGVDCITPKKNIE